MRLTSTLVLVLSLATGCEELDETLTESRMCGAPCAYSEDGTLLLGQEATRETCNAGVLTCSQYEETCVGWVPYGEELCDGIDNDCDGEVDDNAKRGESDPVCGEGAEGVCAYSAQTCRDGEWVCIPPVGYGAEVCDGIDNDCDGKIDGEDASLEMDGDLIGYDGPLETLNVGACRGYVRRCLNGFEQKIGQVVPEPEVCGDGLDNDCDGFIDENEGDNVDDAFLLLIDGSGSMESVPQIITTAICAWSSEPKFAESRFSIVLVGLLTYLDDFGGWNYTDYPYARMVSDFATAGAVCEALQNAEYQSGGVELFPEVILGSHVANSEFLVTWPQDLDKQVVVFSDERPQSPTPSTPAFGNSPDQAQLPSSDTWQNSLVIEDCQSEANDYRLNAFTNLQNENEWEVLTDGCGGWTDRLSNDPETMTERLLTRFKGKC